MIGRRRDSGAPLDANDEFDHARLRRRSPRQRDPPRRPHPPRQSPYRGHGVAVASCAGPTTTTAASTSTATSTRASCSPATSRTSGVSSRRPRNASSTSRSSTTSARSAGATSSSPPACRDLATTSPAGCLLEPVVGRLLRALHEGDEEHWRNHAGVISTEPPARLDAAGPDGLSWSRLARAAPIASAGLAWTPGRPASNSSRAGTSRTAPGSEYSTP